MKKLILVLTISVVLFSCSRNKIENNIKNDSTGKNVEKSKPKDNKIKLSKKVELKNNIDFTLDSFNNIPEEIDGCSCYFYLSLEDKKNEKFIFINDFANTSFVSINNKIEKFNLIKHDEKKDIYLYNNKSYNLKIEIFKKEDGLEEESNLEGIIILSKGNNVIKKDFLGTCGC